jgi:hypothetical protein
MTSDIKPLGALFAGASQGTPHDAGALLTGACSRIEIVLTGALQPRSCWVLGAACCAMRQTRRAPLTVRPGVSSQLAPAEPAADAEPFAPRRQHLVHTSLRQKANQPAADRLDINCSIISLV